MFGKGVIIRVFCTEILCDNIYEGKHLKYFYGERFLGHQVFYNKILYSDINGG